MNNETVKVGDTIVFNTSPSTRFIITNVYRDGSVDLYNEANPGSRWYRFRPVDYKLIKTQVSITEKFVTALLPEPEKSFRKAGITNGDGLLTADGQMVFLGYLLDKNKTAFNEDVVQALLKSTDK